MSGFKAFLICLLCHVKYFMLREKACQWVTHYSFVECVREVCNAKESLPPKISELSSVSIYLLYFTVCQNISMMN